jgi:hypothetical protein
VSEQTTEILPKVRLITTARGLDSYCYDLGIAKELLATGKVLNVGCGASNIDKEMPEVNQGVVNIDIQHDPYFSIMHKPIRSIAAKLATVFAPKNYILKRKLGGIEGRTLAQADMLNLPFAENQFDFVIAYWSTYQLPIEKRVEAYKEIIRVGKRIHIAPIFKVDLNSLLSMRKDLDFTIVSSSPLPEIFDDPESYTQIKDVKDYGNYIHENPNLSSRLYMPKGEDISYRKNGRMAKADGGNSVILCKNAFL